MAAGMIINYNGSISNRVLASNIKNDWQFPSNIQTLNIECETPENKEIKDTKNDMINSITIGEYGLAGLSFNSQRCAHSLKTRIENGILRAEEKSAKQGNTNRIQFTTMFPTGTSSSVSPIAAYAGKNIGLNPIVFAVIPDLLSESFQLINTIYGIALSSFNPMILVDEGFSELVSDETKMRAGLAAGGDPSKFYKLSQFSLEFSCKIARLLSGISEKESNEKSDDDLSFLDIQWDSIRNQSRELETAIGGRQELFVLHYARSQNNNFEEMGILKPTIKAECPGDPIALVEYNSQLSEDEVGNALITSFERQDLKLERMLFLASDHNELTVLIPSKVPSILKDLINYVKKDRELQDVLKKWAKKTILSNIPPIRRGYENKILKNRMSQIFFNDKSEAMDLAKSIGFSMDIDELKDRNFLFYLAEEEDVFLRPIGGGA